MTGKAPSPLIYCRSPILCPQPGNAIQVRSTFRLVISKGDLLIERMTELFTMNLFALPIIIVQDFIGVSFYEFNQSSARSISTTTSRQPNIVSPMAAPVVSCDLMTHEAA